MAESITVTFPDGTVMEHTAENAIRQWERIEFWRNEASKLRREVDLLREEVARISEGEGDG